MKGAIPGLIALALIMLCIATPCASADWSDEIQYITKSPFSATSGMPATINITLGGTVGEPITIDEVNITINFSPSNLKSWILFSGQRVLEEGKLASFVGIVEIPSNAEGSYVMAIVVTAHTASNPIPSTHSWSGGIVIVGSSSLIAIAIVIILLVAVAGFSIFWLMRSRRRR